jgi:glycosyltransferase involved in cell wall biosynthesis
MHILVINWRCIKNPLAGGAEIYFQEIFRRLVKKGLKITQLAVKFPKSSEKEIIDGIEILRMGDALTFNFTVMRELPHILEASDYELVIDDINKIPFFSPWFTKKPVLALVMHLFRKSIFREVSFLKAGYVYLAECLIPLCYKNNYFATLSLSSKEDLVKMGIKESKISVIPPGIDLEKYQPDFCEKKEKLILHVGRLKRYKSVDHLILAAHKLIKKRQDFKVIIVGTGDDEERLKKLTYDLDLTDYVIFTGYLSDEEKIRYYKKARVLVENSIKEGWGMITIEANACGTPVISSKSPGLKDAVVDGVTGFLYEYGNIQELVEKLEQVLSDDELTIKMAQAGIEWAKQFSWDKASEKMLEVINNAIKRDNID